MAPPKGRKGKPARYPDELEIEGRTFTVHYVNADHPQVAGERLLGCAELSKDAAWVNLDQADHSLRDTTLHEMLHLLFGLAGLTDDEHEEERIICWATRAIWQLEAGGWLKVRF